MKKIKVRYRPAEGLDIPVKATQGSSGYDVFANIGAVKILFPGDRHAFPTALFVEIERGYELQVRSRSGLAINSGVVVLNSPGTIDADFRGEVKVILINNGDAPFTVSPGMRIAQLVAAEVVDIEFEPAAVLTDSLRDDNGFGSTGV